MIGDTDDDAIIEDSMTPPQPDPDRERTNVSSIYSLTKLSIGSFNPSDFIMRLVHQRKGKRRELSKVWHGLVSRSSTPYQM